VTNHVALGAWVIADHEHWTVLADPAGREYCLIRRPPIRAGQSSTAPEMRVWVPPAIQTVPSGSAVTCTRPRRPRAVPWAAV
jgi:hypothetical protein